MQTPKTRNGSSEVPQKVSPRAARQLRPTAIDTDSASSLSQANKISKERSPKVADRRSPRSPVPERKRPSRISELESQVSQLQEDLKVVREQLIVTESCKKQAQRDAEESREQLLALSAKLQDSQKQLLDLSATAEIQHHLKAQLGSADAEMLSLKQSLSETLAIVDDMRIQLRSCKESEAQAQALANETLLQLEAANKTVEILRADGHGIEQELKEGDDPTEIEAEMHSLKAEVGRLRSALESAEAKYQEEEIRSTVQIRNAYELMEQIRSESSRREAELERKKAEIEELKANLMDKETELQGIVEENENLNSKLDESVSSQREHKLKKLDESVAELKADLMDKETALQSISEENEALKLEISKRFSEGEAAKAGEREALAKLGIVMEEADRSSRKAARVAEQLEASQAANSEMEAELRRLKVQSDQWRKAAEAAASMLSAGNNGKITERTVSLDSNNYKCSPFSEHMDNDDDLQRKKNGNMLKKIGVLWKKPQK